MSTPSTLNFANFLSPVLHETYAFIASYVGERVGQPATLHVGQSLEEFVSEQRSADIGFLCGLLYVHAMRKPDCPFELLVAPVLQGPRYQQRPIYYSDVIVRSDSPYTTFADLQDRTWAYNERASHSGYNLVYASLLTRKKSLDYFAETLATGSHLQSLQAVLVGKVDAAALDSHLLDTLLLQQPALAQKIRVVDMLGPSTIPPIVIARELDAELKQRVRTVLVSMHKDPLAAKELHKGCIERFIPMRDADYDDLRTMFARVQQEPTWQHA
ncbi:MAG: PhnD/SsuA/transferrin family substrate-binding protein [Chloroflexota bacterium]|nr:PhnD/SsuA/transferrin family substrate-binding protein [Chloroflexota bacterium]